MGVRHTAGTVFKAFAAHVAIFFMRMADFALTVLRVTRNVVAVTMFMSTAATIFVFMMVMFSAATAFAMLMFVVALMSAATFSMTMFVMVVFFPTTAAEMMVLMFFTAAGNMFMVVVMHTHFIAAVSYIR